MATFWERTAHSDHHIFSLLCLFVVLVVSHFGFEGGNRLRLRQFLVVAYLLLFKRLSTLRIPAFLGPLNLGSCLTT